MLDPDRTLGDDQLNGGAIVPFTRNDWLFIAPFLRENERLFGLRVNELLKGYLPEEVYRKVVPAGAAHALDAHT